MEAVAMPDPGFGIIAPFLLLSLAAPIILTFIPTPELWKVARFAWAILLSIFFISCGLLASMGERGFLSGPQGAATGSLFLAVSVGLGCVFSLIYHRNRPKE
jgi:hypothetical protein